MKDLISLAQEVRQNAYAPYSGYAVGAAIRTPSGATFVGCNFENLSYGLTICAERNAIGAMIAAGEPKWAEIAVVTADGGAPCGACLQVLLEFAEDHGNAWVHCASESGDVVSRRLVEYLPFGFASDQVRKQPGESN